MNVIVLGCCAGSATCIVLVVVTVQSLMLLHDTNDPMMTGWIPWKGAQSADDDMLHMAIVVLVGGSHDKLAAIGKAE